MKYGELKNIMSVATGIAIILFGSITAYFAQKKLFKKKQKQKN